MEIDGDEYLYSSSLALSVSLLYKYGLAHARTWTYFLSLLELHEIHPQLYSVPLTTARESFSRLGLVSAGRASPLSAQPLLPWRGEASSVEVLSAPI